jgi:hypothetical protein
MDESKVPRVLVTLGLFLFFVTFSLSSIGQGYDVSHQDPQGDVIHLENGETQPAGFEYIDILAISSSENILGTQIVFEMRVVGVITNSEDITYAFAIMDDGELVYYITYSNGVGMGVNMDDGSNSVLQASGTGTDTLEVRLQISEIGELSNYDLAGSTLEYVPSNEEYFLDGVPDSGIDINTDYNNLGEMPVSILKPRSGATASQTIMISGRTRSEYDMISVEIQFDSKSNDNWILTTTTDDWGNWSYEWDSKEHSEGKHTLHARAFNGTDYFSDSAIVYVDQENAQNPKIAKKPKISINEKYFYEIEVDIPNLVGSIDYTSSGTMNYTVEATEDIVVGGLVYETYSLRIESIQYSEMDEVKSTIYQEGYNWVRTSDLAMVKSEIMTVSETTIDGDTSVSHANSTTTFSPPFDNYNFPISIAETWAGSYEIISKIETESDTIDDTFDGTLEFEALHIENTQVPAGLFETFVIWSQDYFSSDSSIACNLDYYSPKLGFPVKMETYDSHRNVISTMELQSYEKEISSDQSDGDGIFGDDGSLLLPVLLILLIIIIIAVSLGYMRYRRNDDDIISPSKENKGPGDSVSPNDVRLTVHPLKPGITKVKGDSKDHKGPALRFVKCAKCSHLLSADGDIKNIKCPYCGTIQMG